MGTNSELITLYTNIKTALTAQFEDYIVKDVDDTDILANAIYFGMYEAEEDELCDYQSFSARCFFEAFITLPFDAENPKLNIMQAAFDLAAYIKNADFTGGSPPENVRFAPDSITDDLEVYRVSWEQIITHYTHKDLKNEI